MFSFLGALPFGSTRYILDSSPLPPILESKAISLPSGDQRGVPVPRMPKDVSCSAFEPSASQTHTSLPPVLSDSNAILRPSGEMLGAICLRDEVTNSRGCGGDPCKSRRQMFTLIRI